MPKTVKTTTQTGARNPLINTKLPTDNGGILGVYQSYKRNPNNTNNNQKTKDNGVDGQKQSRFENVVRHFIPKDNNSSHEKHTLVSKIPPHSGATGQQQTKTRKNRLQETVNKAKIPINLETINEIGDHFISIVDSKDGVKQLVLFDIDDCIMILRRKYDNKINKQYIDNVDDENAIILLKYLQEKGIELGICSTSTAVMQSEYFYNKNTKGKKVHKFPNIKGYGGEITLNSQEKNIMKNNINNAQYLSPEQKTAYKALLTFDPNKLTNNNKGELILTHYVYQKYVKGVTGPIDITYLDNKVDNFLDISGHAELAKLIKSGAIKITIIPIAATPNEQLGTYNAQTVEDTVTTEAVVKKLGLDKQKSNEILTKAGNDGKITETNGITGSGGVTQHPAHNNVAQDSAGSNGGLKSILKKTNSVPSKDNKGSFQDSRKTQEDLLNKLNLSQSDTNKKEPLVNNAATGSGNQDDEEVEKINGNVEKKPQTPPVSPRTIINGNTLVSPDSPPPITQRASTETQGSQEPSRQVNKQQVSPITVSNFDGTNNDNKLNPDSDDKKVNEILDKKVTPSVTEGTSTPTPTNDGDDDIENVELVPDGGTNSSQTVPIKHTIETSPPVTVKSFLEKQETNKSLNVITEKTLTNNIKNIEFDGKEDKGGDKGGENKVFETNNNNENTEANQFLGSFNENRKKQNTNGSVNTNLINSAFRAYQKKQIPNPNQTLKLPRKTINVVHTLDTKPKEAPLVQEITDIKDDCILFFGLNPKNKEHRDMLLAFYNDEQDYLLAANCKNRSSSNSASSAIKYEDDEINLTKKNILEYLNGIKNNNKIARSSFVPNISPVNDEDSKKRNNTVKNRPKTAIRRTDTYIGSKNLSYLQIVTNSFLDFKKSYNNSKADNSGHKPTINNQVYFI